MKTYHIILIVFLFQIPTLTLSVLNKNIPGYHWSFLNTFSVCTINFICHFNFSEITHNILRDAWESNFVRLQNSQKFNFTRDLDTDSASNISIDISPGNTSMLNLRLFLSKFRPVCNIEILFTVLADATTITIDNLEFKFQYERVKIVKYDKRNQLDFIFIPFTVKVLNLRTIYSIQNIFTRAAVILIDVNCEDILFSNFAKANIIEIVDVYSRYRIYELFSVEISLHKIDIKSIKSPYIFKCLLDRYQFKGSQFKLSNYCPIETKRLRSSNNQINYISWSQCVRELIKEKLNCTSVICAKTLSAMYRIELSTSINNFSLLSPFGSEDFGIQYSLFYNNANGRNIFALISPFSLSSWIVIIISSYVVALLLFLSKINNYPFFWLFTILLEQNCANSSKVTN